MRWKEILVLSLVAGFSGCATFPDIVYKSAPIKLSDSDAIDSPDAAKDAIGLLRDGTFQKPGPFEDVEVTNSSVTVRTFKSGKSKSADFYYRGFSRGSSVFSESRGQVSIWLADVVAISVERQINYSLKSVQDGGGYSPSRDFYVCLLKLKDGRCVPFRTIEEDYAKRVAAGFSYLTKIGVGASPDYPPVGCDIEGRDNQVVAELIDGPFDKAGIPLASSVVGIDGKDISDDQMSEKLAHLGPGVHHIRIVISGELFSDTKDVFVPATEN